MASYHLSVKTIKRSAGRSATAAAAYRSGERIECQREGRIHDYTRKQGIEETFIVTPKDAPEWAEDRAALWNAAEESETRRNSVTAREWELGLPSEISAEARSQITRDFAQELVDRYGVAVDVAIHAPHREGDQRNHHAHVLTTTRKLEEDGFTAKTRVLDAAQTGGVEIEQMRAHWAELQNHMLEREGGLERVDHRTLEAQRESALERGDDLEAEALDRAPEVKLGPAANAIERWEMYRAAREGREYEPVTERGAMVHAARQARAAFEELRYRVELARETYSHAREEGQGRVSAGLSALRAAMERDDDRGREPEDINARLQEIVDRSGQQEVGPNGLSEEETFSRSDPDGDGSADGEALGERSGVDRLREIMDREAASEGDEAEEQSIEERLGEVLKTPAIEQSGVEVEEEGAETLRERERGLDRSVGLEQGSDDELDEDQKRDVGRDLSDGWSL